MKVTWYHRFINPDKKCMVVLWLGAMLLCLHLYDENIVLFVFYISMPIMRSQFFFFIWQRAYQFCGKFPHSYHICLSSIAAEVCFPYTSKRLNKIIDQA